MDSGPLDFELEIHQNKYLARGARRVDAVIEVRADGAGGHAGTGVTAAQVIMIDCSSSMGGSKIVEARRATLEAVNLLRDGVAFAIVAGTTSARMVYPGDQRMALSSPATRAEARREIRTLRAAGGTAIGTWLELTNELLADQPAEIKHAILLTDGKNEHQGPTELRAVLDRCRGRFVCDTRGVGMDWVASLLTEVADALDGTPGGLKEPAGLTADFVSMTDSAMRKATADVVLRVRHPVGVRVLRFRQIEPHSLDLTERGSALADRVIDYPTGSWAAETKLYEVTVELPAGKQVDRELRAANVEIVAGGRRAGERPVLAVWTDDQALTTRKNEWVAHATAQRELIEAVEEGSAALSAGDKTAATARLGEAAQLATKLGDLDALEKLERVVVLHDAASGRVELRDTMAQVDMEMLAVTTRKTVRLPRPGSVL